MTEEKRKIERSHFKTNDLKRLIIRIDYIGVTNIESLVLALKKSYSNIYRYKKEFIRDREKIKDLENTLNMDSHWIMETPIHVFYYVEPETNERLNIEISEYSICVELNCKEYKGFDWYSGILTTIYNQLILDDKYIEVRRIGISKTSAFWDEDPDKIREALEEETVPYPMVDEYQAKCFYSDKFYWKDYDVDVALNRSLSWGTVKKGNLQHQAWQIILNYEVSKKFQSLYEKTFYDEEKLSDLLKVLNDAHFELFKRSMTIDYLKKHCNG